MWMVHDRNDVDTTINDEAVAAAAADGDSMIESNDYALSSSSEVAHEQLNDMSLNACSKLAENGQGGLLVKEELL